MGPLTQTSVRLECLLNVFGLYCQREALWEITPKLKNLFLVEDGSCINGESMGNIEQVSFFSNLVIIKLVVRYTCSHNRREVLIFSANCIVFHQTQGSKLIAPALRVFEVRLGNQILYSAEIWGWNDPRWWEMIHNKFLRKSFELPNNTSSYSHAKHNSYSAQCAIITIFGSPMFAKILLSRTAQLSFWMYI